MSHHAYEVRLPSGHLVSDDRARLDMALVHARLSQAYWATNRPREQTDRSWAHCLPFGLHAPDGELAGFARVLTDHTFRAHLADLMIHVPWRGQGLGKGLVAAVLAHPALAGVAHWSLTTSDAHRLYEPFGFRVGVADGRSMVLNRPTP